MLVNENASVAIIGMAVKARNPMSHGAMKTYPQRARRQASPENRDWRGGRAMLGAAMDQLPPASQTACISARRASISAVRSRPGVVCHLVPYLLSRSRVWLYAGMYDSKLGTSAKA